MTLKQKQLLARIWQFEQEKRIAPSLSDVKTIMGVKSFQSVIDMLNRLETAGWITKKANKARSLLLTTKAKEQLIAIGVEHMVSYKFDNTNTVDAKGSNATQSLYKKDIGFSFISIRPNTMAYTKFSRKKDNLCQHLKKHSKILKRSMTA